MTRLLVLVLCLASAAGIAGYTYFSGERIDPAAVYVVPPRPPEAKSKTPPVTTANIDPNDRVALARALQRELKRVGCYSGEITGVWTTSTRMAMRAFTERVNAALPIDKPDPVLLSLVQGHQQGDVCTPAPGPAGPTKDAKTQATDDAAPGAAKDAAKDKTDPAGAAAASAAALALTAPAAKAVPKAKSDAAEEARPAAVKPAPREEGARDKDARDRDKKEKSDVDAPKGGPVPAEGMRGKRQRRSDQASSSRPPKVVRDVLKALGF